MTLSPPGTVFHPSPKSHLLGKIWTEAIEIIDFDDHCLPGVPTGNCISSEIYFYQTSYRNLLSNTLPLMLQEKFISCLIRLQFVMKFINILLETYFWPTHIIPFIYRTLSKKMIEIENEINLSELFPKGWKWMNWLTELYICI